MKHPRVPQQLSSIRRSPNLPSDLPCKKSERKAKGETWQVVLVVSQIETVGRSYYKHRFILCVETYENAGRKAVSS